MLPILFDAQGESNAFELELLWKREEVDDLEAEENTAGGSSQFVIDDDEDESDEDSAKKQPPSAAPPKPKAKKQLPSIGEKLFNSLIDLMFCCGFTISPKLQVDHHKINYVIWYVRRSVLFVCANFVLGKRVSAQHQTLPMRRPTIITRQKFSASCSSSYLVRSTSPPHPFFPSPRSTPFTLSRRFRDATF